MSGLKQTPRDILRQLVSISDSDHSKALGAAIGVFIAMTPTVGIQTVSVIVVAAVTFPFFHFNRFAAFVDIYLSNPITIVPIYWMNYKVGTWFVGGSLNRTELARVLEYDSLAEWWQTILNLFIGIIVSTMQELASLPDPNVPDADLKRTLSRMETDLATLRAHLDERLGKGQDKPDGR